MNETERLVALTAISGKMSQIRCDDFCSREQFIEPKHTAIGHIHLGPVFRHSCTHMVGVPGQDWCEAHLSTRRQGQDEIHRAGRSGKQVTRLGENNFTSDRRLTKRIEHLPRPRVMRISDVGEGHERASVENVTRASHAENPRAMTDRPARSSLHTKRGRIRAIRGLFSARAPARGFSTAHRLPAPLFQMPCRALTE